jgi:hypothetical protein
VGMAEQLAISFAIIERFAIAVTKLRLATR